MAINLGTTGNSSTLYSSQRRIQKTSDGKLVVFGLAVNSVQIAYKVSLDDGASFGSWITVYNSYTVNNFDTYIDSGDNIYLAIYTGVGYLEFIKLTYGSGTWSIGSTIHVDSSSHNIDPSITIRANGDIWIAASAVTTFYGYYSTDGGGTWNTTSSNPGYGIEGRALIPYNTDIWLIVAYNASLYYYEYTSSWSSANLISSSITAARLGVGKVSDSEIYAAIKTSSGIKVFKYTGSWDSGTLLGSASTDTNPSVSIAGSSPIVIYEISTNNIVYRKWNGATWDAAVNITNDSNTNKAPSSLANSSSSELYTIWTTGTSTYTMYFQTTNLVITSQQTINSSANINAISQYTTNSISKIINFKFQDFILSNANIIKAGVQLITSIASIKQIGTQQTLNSDTAISYGKGEQLILSSGTILQRILSELSSDTSITPAYHSKFINNKDLFISTQSSPTNIIKVNISSVTPTWVIYPMIIGLNNARNLVLNFSNLKLYTTCDNGYIIKSRLESPSTTTIIYVGEDISLIPIAHLSDYRYTYVGADLSTGELFMIDETTEQQINTDFRFFKLLSRIFKNFLSFLKGKLIDTDLRFLTIIREFIKTDLRFLKTNYSAVQPLARDSFIVKIDETQNNFVKLDSININMTADTQIVATFRMARRHDKLDFDLNGNYIPITTQNNIKIYIANTLIFDGKVSIIKANSETEDVEVTAEGDYPILPPEEGSVTPSIIMDKGTKDLPLTILNNKLGLYDILLNDIQIENPEIDPNDINPKYFSGIKAYLGDTEFEAVYQEDAKYTFGDAEEFENFVPEPNYEYFWYASGINFVDGFSFSFKYIGTSLASLSNDTFDIREFSYKKQRKFRTFSKSAYIATSFSTVVIGLGSKTFYTQYGLAYNSGMPVRVTSALNEGDYMEGTVASYDNFNLVINATSFGGTGTKNNWAITPLQRIASYYYVGSEPFKEISVKNGWYAAEPYWEDREDGLYQVMGSIYNFVPYVKQVAQVEYTKMCNINGDVLPSTTANLSLTIDAYLYYNLRLLNRVNIINTTQSDIYENNHGFPVSIKSIMINSQDMLVTITCDNQWSRKELDLLDASLPPEPHVSPPVAFKIENKFDLNLKEDIT
jgi:hypothetical protein